MMVARTWQQYCIQRHRVEKYCASNDPDFETKAADIIGLYLNPPQHGAVFCVDEKTAIQALDRTLPVLSLLPGRAERHGLEYVRNGTLSLYAAFNTNSGEIFGKTTSRHTRRSSWTSSCGSIPIAPALHPDILLLAQPSGAVVLQDRTRPQRCRCALSRSAYAAGAPLAA